jgi:hypothetical protein
MLEGKAPLNTNTDLCPKRSSEPCWQLSEQRAVASGAAAGVTATGQATATVPQPQPQPQVPQLQRHRLAQPQRHRPGSRRIQLTVRACSVLCCAPYPTGPEGPWGAERRRSADGRN